jgi:hypothetical protein
MSPFGPKAGFVCGAANIRFRAQSRHGRPNKQTWIPLSRGRPRAFGRARAIARILCAGAGDARLLVSPDAVLARSPARTMSARPKKDRGRAGRFGSGRTQVDAECANLKCSDPRASTPRDIEACRSRYCRKSASPKASRARCL